MMIGHLLGIRMLSNHKKVSKNTIKKIELDKRGWDKPLKYDDEGKIIWPNIDEIIQCINSRKLDHWDEATNTIIEHQSNIPDGPSIEQKAGKTPSTRKTKPNMPKKTGTSKKTRKSSGCKE